MKKNNKNCENEFNEYICDLKYSIGKRIDIRIRICAPISKFLPSEQEIRLKMCGKTFNHVCNCVYLGIDKNHFISLYGDKKLSGREILNIKNAIVIVGKYGNLELYADEKAEIAIEY